MIENLTDEFNWNVNMQKVQNFVYIYIYYIRGKNAPKLVSMYLKDNMQNQTFFKLYNDDKKYTSNPNNILKSAEKLL